MKRALVACPLAFAAILAVAPLVARGHIDQRASATSDASQQQLARFLDGPAAPCTSEKTAGTLDGLLDCARRYVRAFKRQFPSAVAEEQRTQGVIEHRQFRIRSELVLLDRPDGQGWLEFRDAFESDGRPVGGKDPHRLSALLLTPGREVLAAARRLTHASGDVIESRRRTVEDFVPTSTTFFARLAPLLDTALSPMTILSAGRTDFRFSLAGEERVGGIATRKVDYRRVESSEATAIGGPTRLTGTVWIHQRTGAVLRTSLEAAEGGDTGLSGSERVLRTVEYGPDLAGGVVIPRAMSEERILRVFNAKKGYVSNGFTEKATVTYVNFRPLTTTPRQTP